MAQNINPDQWQKQLRQPLSGYNFKPAAKLYNQKVIASFKKLKGKENVSFILNHKSVRNGTLHPKMPNLTTGNNTKSNKYWDTKAVPQTDKPFKPISKALKVNSTQPGAIKNAERPYK